MKYLVSILFSCATFISVAQENFVRNPDLEQYSICPDQFNNLVYCNHWSNVIDTFSTDYHQPEYYNACGNKYPDVSRHIPLNVFFYQYPHSDSGMAGLTLYYDKTAPPPPFPTFDYRDYLQGRLFKPLVNGKAYCVSFWVNMAEFSYYGQNKIGAYLDNGAINKLPLPPGSEVTSVLPQIYTNDTIIDTANWVKIEGSFVANGTETHITIGNFFPNSAVDTITTNYWFGSYQYSYYLIDDVSVVAIDAKANAGVDRWVEQGKSTPIGPVEDSTARGMECKWYHKGKLIDSGNVISVNASSIKYAVDTYVVVQNVCGNITRDTMLLRTVGLGIPLLGGARGGFTIYPNPSNGNFSIKSFVLPKESVSAKVYDLLGRIVHQERLNFYNKEATLKLNIPAGSYILELKDDIGNVQRERIVIND